MPKVKSEKSLNIKTELATFSNLQKITSNNIITMTPTISTPANFNNNFDDVFNPMNSDFAINDFTSTNFTLINNMSNTNNTVNYNDVGSKNEIISSIFSPTQNNFDDDMDLSDEEVKLLQNPPYELTLSFEELISPADNTNKPSRKPKKNRPSNSAEVASTTTIVVDIKIPRPQNAWVLFRKDYEAKQRLRFPEKALKMKNISTDAGEHWRNESMKVKRFFDILSKLAHEKHKSIYPAYKYTPKKKTVKDNNSALKDWIFKDEFIQPKLELEFDIDVISNINDINNMDNININDINNMDSININDINNMNDMNEFTNYNENNFENDFYQFINAENDLNGEENPETTDTRTETGGGTGTTTDASVGAEPEANGAQSSATSSNITNVNTIYNQRETYPEKIFKMEDISKDAKDAWNALKKSDPTRKVEFFEILSKLDKKNREMISLKELEDDDEKKLEWREVHFDNKNDSNFIYINRDGNDSNNNSSSNNNIITTFDTTMYNASNYQDAQNTYPYSSQEVELVEPGQLSLSQLLHLFCNQEIFNMEDDEMFNTVWDNIQHKFISSERL
nr:14259_t:CDS:2 [Entrophospora candida]